MPDRGEGAFGPYARAVRRHPVLIAVVALATLLVAVAWLARRDDSYRSTAQVLITPVSGGVATSGLPILTDSVDPTRTLQTAATILDSPRAALVASRALGANWSIARVEDATKVEALGDSNVVAVTATAAGSGAAVAVANAFARAALEVRGETLRAQVKTQLTGLQARRDALGDSDPATSAELAATIAELETIRDGQDPNFSLLQSATGAESTLTPAWMIAAMGLIAGLVIGVAAALTLEQLDRRLRDEDALVEAYPLPVLTRAPVVRRRGRETPAALREAFLTLQVQLQNEDRQGQIVMLTSASVGDGKTTSAIELARSFAAGGARVVLLDLDLRKPDVGARLGVDCDVLPLFGRRPRLESALVQAPEDRELFVLAPQSAGERSSLLDALSRHLPELLDQARQLGDVVIVDTAPLGRVSDALRIAALADDLLLVARPGNTNRGDLAVTRELLEHMGIVPTGMVVVGGVRGGPGSYGYGATASSPVRSVAASRASARMRVDELDLPR